MTDSCLMHFVLKAGIAFSQHALLLLEGLYSLLQLLHIPFTFPFLLLWHRCQIQHICFGCLHKMGKNFLLRGLGWRYAQRGNCMGERSRPELKKVSSVYT